MTEDEARQKWCPMVGDPDVTRPAKHGTVPNCIASDCMMWRNEGVYGDDDNNDPVHGYCGLAGKPHV